MRHCTLTIAAYVAIGFLLQLVLHGVLEMVAIALLVAEFETYGLGLTWQQWFTVHHIFSVLFVIIGIGAGAWFGIGACRKRRRSSN